MIIWKDAEKRIWQNLASIHDLKNYQQTRNQRGTEPDKENLPNQNTCKRNRQNKTKIPQATTYLMVKGSIFLPIIKNQGGMFTFTSFIHLHTWSPFEWNEAIKRNKMHTNWKRRNKSVVIHRCHNFLNRKSPGIYKNRH